MKTEPFVVFDDPYVEITEDQIRAVLEWRRKNQHLFTLKNADISRCYDFERAGEKIINGLRTTPVKRSTGF